jgi:hypothetical protein
MATNNVRQVAADRGLKVHKRERSMQDTAINFNKIQSAMHSAGGLEGRAAEVETQAMIPHWKKYFVGPKSRYILWLYRFLRLTTGVFIT